MSSSAFIPASLISPSARPCRSSALARPVTASTPGKATSTQATYGPEVLDRLKDDHDSRYAGFSQLIQSTFAAALDYFEDQSVDLLHIDGRHFYEDVRDDFESWQPKLSKSAVVLFHDTNVREKEFGVWRLWQELASDYPSFEFKHGHGLGVLGVGKEIPLPLRPLFFGSEASRERIRQIYARLGMTVAERLDLSSAREGIALRDSELGMLRSEVKARAEAFLALEAETDRLRSNLLAKQAPLEKECSALRADIGNKTEEIARLRTQLDSSAKSAAELRAELTRKSGELSSAQVQCGALQSRIGVVDEEFRRKVEEVSNLKTELDARQSRIAVIDAEFARKVDEISLAKAELDARQNRIAVLEEDAAQKARALLSAQAELATSQDRIGVLEAEAFRAKDGLAELETLRQANAALQVISPRETMRPMLWVVRSPPWWSRRLKKPRLCLT